MSSVSMTELEMALQFLQGMEPDEVYVSKQTGKIHILPSDLDAGEEVPEDIESSDEFVVLPHRRDFDLGNRLAFRFTELEMPHEYDNVRAMFQHKGAYGRYKHLLQSKNLVERWNQFEEDQTRAALREWCDENGLQVEK